MSTPNIDYLRDQVDKLKMLLDDPQPGLASWCMMYGERMTAINDFWNGIPNKSFDLWHENQTGSVNA